MSGWKFVRVLLALIVVATFSSAFAQGVPVSWDVKNVAITIGDGQGSTSPVTVSFRSARALQDIELVVVPALQGLVHVTPTRIARVEPDTEYSVTLTFAIPPEALEGVYDGTLHLISGRRTIPQSLKLAVTVAYGSNIVDANTRVLTAATASLLSEVSADGSALTFNTLTPDLAAVSIGSVLVLPPSPALPLGFLGRVVAVIPNGVGMIVNTVPAAITDALSSIDINLAVDLSQANLLALQDRPTTLRGVPLKAASEGVFVSLDGYEVYKDSSGRAIELSGSLSASPTFTFNLTAQDWQLKRLSFIDTTKIVAKLGVTAEAAVPILSKKFQVGSPIYFTPITVWAGPVPVVFTPQLTFLVGIEGNISVGLTTSVTQTSTTTVGVKFDNGDWSTVSDRASSFSWDPLRASAGVDAQLFGGPQFNLLLYGVIGPYASARAKVELDVDLLDHPQYQIFGGLEAGAGVRLDLFGYELADKDWPALIGYQKLLAEGDFGSWRRRSSFPPFVDLVGALSFSLKGQGYVVLPCWVADWSTNGVYCSGATMGQVWRFDPSSNRWTRLRNHPTGLQYRSPVFTLNGAAYVVSGNQVWKYSGESDEWTRKSDIPGDDKVGGFAFSVGGYGYVGGGFYNKGALWRYNASSDAWTRRADHPYLSYGSNDPTVRSVDGISFELNGKAYVTGTNHYFWQYSPSSDSWSMKAYVNAVYGRAFVAGSNGYVFNTFGELFEYDVSLNSWTMQPVFPGQEVCHPAGFVVDGRLYVGIGGRFANYACYGDIVNDWWEYSP